MFSFGKHSSILLCILFVSLVLSFTCEAAQKTFRGDIAVEQTYDSNVDRVPADKQEEWRTMVSPVLLFIVSEQTSLFSAEYAPSVLYNYNMEEERFDHLATLVYENTVSRHLQIDFEDIFVRTDEPYVSPVDAQGGIRLSDRRGRRRYWTNNVIVRARYTYARESFLDYEYQNQVLDNDEDDISDFIRHTTGFSLVHRITEKWNVHMNHSITRGEFDSGEDLSMKSSDLVAHYALTPFTMLLGHYGYARTKYDGDTADYAYNTVGVGAVHQFSSTLNGELEAGITLLQRDGASDSDAFFLRMVFDKNWERSTWRASAESGMDEQYFGGTDNQGLSRYWSIGSEYTKSISRSAFITIDISYREDTYLERQDEEEQLFGSGLRLVYSFGRWYQFSIRYAYLKQTADIKADEYDDHRIWVALSAGKDLIRW